MARPNTSKFLNGIISKSGAYSLISHRIDESAVEASERLSKWDEFLAQEEADKKAAEEEEKKEEEDQDDDSPESQLLPGDATP